jgi:hypothetical protein
MLEKLRREVLIGDLYSRLERIHLLASNNSLGFQSYIKYVITCLLGHVRCIRVQAVRNDVSN